MTNQKILANGPDGWTHVDDEGGYYIIDKTRSCKFVKPNWWCDFDLDWEHISDIRSRSDIERIVYLESVLKGEAA